MTNEWDEERMNIVGRNGNDGAHYAETELTYREVCDAVAAKNQAERESQRTQIGGSHYILPIQPIEFIVKNNIPFREANIIKYVVRYKDKNGIEDLKKARHYLDMIIEDYNAN